MDKNAIKKYAVWARKELISRVAQKAQQYGITETEMVDAGADSVNGRVLTAQEMQQRRALIAHFLMAFLSILTQSLSVLFCLLRLVDFQM